MRLHTFHPPGILIDRLKSIDPTQGPYWGDPFTHRYKEALPRLCKMLRIRKYPLWCCTDPGAWLPIESRPVVEWELNVPESKIVAFIREPVWHAFICGQSDDWENVIIKERPIQPGRNVSALVKVPLSPGCATCRGRLVNPLWRQEVEFLKTQDVATQWRYVNMYRDRAANPKAIDIARKMDRERADYYEEVLGLKPQSGKRR